MPFYNPVMNVLRNLSLLVDPGSAVALVVNDLTLLEPESNLLLGVLDRVGTVADVSADLRDDR